MHKIYERSFIQRHVGRDDGKRVVDKPHAPLERVGPGRSAEHAAMHRRHRGRGQGVHPHDLAALSPQGSVEGEKRSPVAGEAASVRHRDIALGGRHQVIEPGSDLHWRDRDRAGVVDPDTLAAVLVVDPQQVSFRRRLYPPLPQRCPVRLVGRCGYLYGVDIAGVVRETVLPDIDGKSDRFEDFPRMEILGPLAEGVADSAIFLVKGPYLLRAVGVAQVYIEVTDESPYAAAHINGPPVSAAPEPPRLWLDRLPERGPPGSRA